MDNAYRAFEKETLKQLIVDAIQKEASGKEKLTRISGYRIDALQKTWRQMLFYLNEYISYSIIERACQKKIAAILQATTKEALNTILRLPVPQTYGGELVDHPTYRFDEEELIQWMLAVTKDAPGDKVIRRCDTLWQRVFGQSIYDL